MGLASGHRPTAVERARQPQQEPGLEPESSARRSGRPALRRRTKALLIGIADYQNLPYHSEQFGRLLEDLRGPANDIRLMKRVLRYRGFAEGDIMTLIDREATRQGVLAAVDTWLIDGTNEGDLAVFYFSGHGTRVPDLDGDEGSNDSYDEALVPFDMVPETLTTQESRLITDDELHTRFAKLSGRRLVVIVDTCFSGTMTRSFGGGSVSLEPTSAVRARYVPVSCRGAPSGATRLSGRLPGRETPPESDQIFISSSREDQIAVEIELPDGCYGALTSALGEAVLSRENISYQEVFDYAKDVLKDRLWLIQEPQILPPEGEVLAQQVFVPPPASDVPHGGTPGAVAAEDRTSAPQAPTEIQGGSVRLAIDILEGADSSEMEALRSRLRELPYVELTRAGAFYDRLIRGEYQKRQYHLRLLNRVGDVWRFTAANSLDDVVTALTPYLEYAYVIKRFAHIRNRNPPFEVTLEVADGRRDLRLGEKVVFEARCEEDCYLLVLHVDPAANLSVLFPNKYHSHSFVQAGVTIQIPDDRMRQQKFEFQLFAPAGEETVKVIATSKEIELDSLPVAEFQDLFATLPSRPRKPSSPARDPLQEIFTFLQDHSKEKAFRWSEDVVVLRSHE